MRKTRSARALLLALAAVAAASGCATGGVAVDRETADHRPETSSASERERGDRDGAPSPPDAQIADLQIPGPAAEERPAVPNRLGSERVPVRVYEAAPHAAGEDAWATVVWAHGGSFVRGTLDWPEADWVSRTFAEHGVRVVSVDYVLASETVKAPAPANDVTAALYWASAEFPGAVAVGGASAGANLAVQAALQAAQVPEVAAVDALLLLYPTLHRVQREAPEITRLTEGLAESKRFGPARISEMYEHYLGGEAADMQLAATSTAPGSRFSLDPIVIGELPEVLLATLPATVMITAEADDLRASAEEFAEQLRDAGVPVATSVQPGTLHGYANHPGDSERALADAEDTINRFVAQLRDALD